MISKEKATLNYCSRFARVQQHAAYGQAVRNKIFDLYVNVCIPELELDVFEEPVIFILSFRDI